MARATAFDAMKRASGSRAAEGAQHSVHSGVSGLAPPQSAWYDSWLFQFGCSVWVGGAGGDAIVALPASLLGECGAASSAPPTSSGAVGGAGRSTARRAAQGAHHWSTHTRSTAYCRANCRSGAWSRWERGKTWATVWNAVTFCGSATLRLCAVQARESRPTGACRSKLVWLRAHGEQSFEDTPAGETRRPSSSTPSAPPKQKQSHSNGRVRAASAPVHLHSSACRGAHVNLHLCTLDTFSLQRPRAPPLCPRSLRCRHNREAAATHGLPATQTITTSHGIADRHGITAGHMIPVKHGTRATMGSRELQDCRKP